MNIFRKSKDNNLKQKLLVEVMKDFLEARMSVFEFWEIYKVNEDLRQLLISDSQKDRKFSTYYDPEHLIQRANLSRLRDRVEIFWAVKRYFTKNKISSMPKNADEEDFIFLTSIQPGWLDVSVEFLVELANSAPAGMTKKEKSEWCKTRLKELFIYENKPPKWLQNPEWPIKNGKPLVFRSQSSEDLDYSISEIEYFFYDPKTNEVVTIEQHD